MKPSSAIARGVLLGALLWLPSASWGQSADDELEDPSAPAAPAHPSNARPDAPAPKVDKELLDSFTPPPAVSPDGGIAVAPPEHAPKWSPPPEAPEAKVEESATLLRALDAVQKALGQRHLAEAQAAATTAVRVAKADGPRAQQRAYEAAANVATQSKNERGLLHAVQGFLHSCGPSNVDACRRRALGWLAAPGLSAAARERLAAVGKEVRKNDECLRAAESGTASPCLLAAERAYRKEGDRLMGARALAVDVARARGGPKAAWMAKLAAAQRACPEERCAPLRGRLTHELSTLYLDAHDPRAAVRLLLSEVQRSSARAPAALRPYGRTADLDAACDVLEHTDTRSSCHALEKSLLGRYVFRDFSREVTPGPGLSPAIVQKVSHEYGVLAEQCLATEGRRAPHPSALRVGAHWTVRNDGHVEQIHFDGQELATSRLGACFKEALALWRYPRYAGELQHVDQAFELRLGSRRPGE